MMEIAALFGAVAVNLIAAPIEAVAVSLFAASIGAVAVILILAPIGVAVLFLMCEHTAGSTGPAAVSPAADSVVAPGG